MLWYVLQTKTGGEEKLIEMIRRMVPQDLYGECFVVYHEQLWRRQQKNFVHVKRAFPGYVFITSREPEALFFCLKKIPAMAKMMVDEEFFFLSLDPEETAFLTRIMDKKHVIGLSYLETDGNGNILQASGPLASCVSRIMCCKFGKRYVIVRLRLMGKEKDVLLGIILKEDISREVEYGKVEAPLCVPERYKHSYSVGGKSMAMAFQDKAGKRMAGGGIGADKREIPLDFSVGDCVVVTDGAFCGMSGRVYQVGSQSVKIGIQFLGRKIEMEMAPGVLRKR